MRADVAVAGESIQAVAPDLPMDGVPTLDAEGMLVLPGCVDVHTHTRLPTDAEPDRFHVDSLAAAYGGTTTFLAFNNPGTGISQAGARSPLLGMREFRERTAGESAVDFGLSAVLTADQEDPVAELPALIAGGVPTFKAFMVYDFRLTDELLMAAMASTAMHGGMLQVHCENATIVDALVRRELAAGRVGCRSHAVSRPTYAEAEATHRAVALSRAAGAPVYIVHLSCADALAEVVAARSRGWPVYAETCPHYLALTDALYSAQDEGEVIKGVVSPPLRSESDREALWAGLGHGGLELVASDHVPDRLTVEKRVPARPFDQISNGAPGIETLLTVVYSQGVATGRISVERMVDVLATTPARLFGMPTKGAVEAGRDADLVVFDPRPRGQLRQATLHHTSDFTPFEGLPSVGRVRDVLLRGSPVIRNGVATAEQRRGRFLERALPAIG